jgi:hypothetical protein
VNLRGSLAAPDHFLHRWIPGLPPSDFDFRISDFAFPPHLWDCGI